MIKIIKETKKDVKDPNFYTLKKSSVPLKNAIDTVVTNGLLKMVPEIIEET